MVKRLNPGNGRMELERLAQHEGGGEVLTSSTMYNRRDRAPNVCWFSNDTTEVLRENDPSQSGIFCEPWVSSLRSRAMKLVSSASSVQRDALCIDSRQELPDALQTSASCCVEDRGTSSSATESSEIANSYFAGRDHFRSESSSSSESSKRPQCFGQSSSTLKTMKSTESVTQLKHYPLECHSCRSYILVSPMVSCSSKGCNWSYHQSCAKKLRHSTWRKNGNFVCPQHICFACGGNRPGRLWRCERCPIASHELCCPWPREIIFSENRPGWAICWRHSCDERLPVKRSTLAVSYLHKQRTSDTKEVFNRLPVLEDVEDFKMSLEFLKSLGNDKEPPPYTHIRRNVFLIKKKRDDADDGVKCLCGSEGSECGEDCDCRVQSMSCSKDCVCKRVCTNKPYRKEKRLKVVKTELCGWGAIAAEIIRKGEFVIEYIGEVIDDAMCEQRLWAMKGRGINNFYMCEIMKDFIIDATFKGNPSRYLNHSCQPNCKLEKWRADGETHAGVFALRDIAVGEPVNYNYKYVEFGANVRCCCGAPNCQGAIGEKSQRNMLDGISQGAIGQKSQRNMMDGTSRWGKKGRRS